MAHILIVDDDPVSVELMTTILREAGHRVSTGDSGLEALKILGIQPEDNSVELPDMVILDLMMPKSDGYTVGTLIRDHTRTKNLPILISSSLSEPSRLFSATVEVDGFLNKTKVVESLASTVGSILATKR
ncbi:MAG: response regulator [Elusimicrobiota bacterium]|jgi:CheY-like chemotaxis protein